VEAKAEEAEAELDKLTEEDDLDLTPAPSPPLSGNKVA
jgi:hypothetical protein